MRKEIRIFAFFLLLFFLLSPRTISAQPAGDVFQFTEILPQLTDNNPAFSAPYKGYFGLPILSGIHFRLKNEYLSYNRIISRDAHDSLRINPSPLFGKLQNDNVLGLDINLDILRIGFRIKEKGFLTFGINERAEGDLSLTKNTLGFLLKGPGANIGKNDLSGNNIGLNVYTSVYAGYAYKINSNWEVGLRLKYLNGLYNVNTKKMNIQWEVQNGDMEEHPQETPFLYTVSIDGSIQTNLPLDSNFKMGSLDLFENMSRNHGFGADIGFQYTSDDHWKIGFSILDMGFITWKHNTAVWESKYPGVPIEFSGIPNIQITPDGLAVDTMISEIVKDLMDTLGFGRNPVEKYRSSLGATFMLNGSYTLAEKHQFGAILKFIQKPYKFDFEIGVAYTFIASKNFAVAVNNIFRRDSWLNFGVGVVGNLGPVQLYLGVSKINSFRVIAMRTLEFQFGINFVIGKQEIFESVRQNSRNESAANKNMYY